MRRCFLVIGAAVWLNPATATAQRLPLIAMPEHYSLTFTPDLARETFEGDAAIRIRILQPTDHVVLNAAELSVQSTSLMISGREVSASAVPEPASETVRLQFSEPVKPGRAELRLAYRGTLNRQLRGFYISEANGRKYAVTQLEATDARRMFPSFDEPAFKATFSIIAIVDRDDSAISNGSITEVLPGPGPGRKTIVFAPTAKMSTYLVALAIGDFECTQPASSTMPLRICATPGNMALTGFAQNSASALLEYLNGYFAIDYPFQKLDLVAIPDFAAGAMENTGAIFFRESLLLIDPERASRAAQTRAALVIAHELAHQWFGNLVTMKWWDDLWLNEGFATWMEIKAVRAWRPDWQIELDELQGVQSAMRIDALPSTRSIRMMAHTPAEINELFDPIAYEKGAAVLRMIEAFVGDQAFRGGINAYLVPNQYDNATAEDFWTIATRATGRPIDRIMSSFVTQPGIPLVSVDAQCANGSTRVSAAQERYSPTIAASVEATQQPTTWAIPVCFRMGGGAGSDDAVCELLDEPREMFTLDKCVPWISANLAGRGYYRTAYSAEDLLELAAADLPAADTLALVTDETALLRTGIRDAATYLRAVESIASDVSSPAVLEAMASGLSYVREYFTTPQTRTAFAQWIRDELGPLSESPESDARYRAARSALLGGVGRDASLLRSAHDAVAGYLAAPYGEATIDPTVLDVLVRLAAVAGDEKLYERYRQRSESARTPEERYRFLHALAAFTEPRLLRRTAEYALSPAVRTQDAALLLARVMDNPVGRVVAWPLVQSEWQALEGRFGAFGGTSRIVESLGAFCSADALEDIRTFFHSHPIPEARRTLEQTLEEIQRCARVAPKQAHQVEQLLGPISSEPGHRRDVPESRAPDPSFQPAICCDSDDRPQHAP